MSHQRDEEYQYLSNRDKKRLPKKGFGYCFSCDKVLVSEWEKCPCCGKRNGISRNKK